MTFTSDTFLFQQKQWDWSILQRSLLKTDWKKMLSNFGFSWLPDRNEMKQSQQLSWHRLTSGFTNFQISAEMGTLNLKVRQFKDIF